MEIEYVLVSILGGLIFWSFGSVILFRLWEIPTRKEWKGFFIGHSKCPHCHHELQARDLIPLVSFFLQKGQCRYCKAPISKVYPLLEIGTMILFLLVVFFLWSEGISTVIAIALLSRLSYIASIYDILKYELHLTAAGGLLWWALILCGLIDGNWVNVLWGWGIFFGVFLGIFELSKYVALWKYGKKQEALGFWDVIYAGIIGILLSIQMNPTSGIERGYIIVLYLILSCLLGIFLYLCIRVWKKDQNILIPFLPAMSLARLIFTFRGKELLLFFIQ